MDEVSEFLQFLSRIHEEDDLDDSQEYEEEFDNEIDDNHYLNSNRIPVSVYKFPIDGSYGSGGSLFQSFETVAGDVLDLSGASDDEKHEFYSLPRSF